MEDVFVGNHFNASIVAFIPLYLWRRSQVSSFHDEHEEQPQVQQIETVVWPTGTRSRMRRRDTSAATSSAPQTVEETEDGSEEEAVEGEYYSAKASKKKGRKKEERQAQCQAEEAARGQDIQNKIVMQKYAGGRMRNVKHIFTHVFYSCIYLRWRCQNGLLGRLESRKLFGPVKTDRVGLEEEAAARKAKEKEAAALEFEKWKGEFSIDAEGTMENEVQDGTQGLLFDFVEYIKKQKCVPLEDLAAEFKLQSQDCINRTPRWKIWGDYLVSWTIEESTYTSLTKKCRQLDQFIDLEPKQQYVEDLAIADDITVA